MSLAPNTTFVQEFISTCFNTQSEWSIREVAISDLGWSLKIEHDKEDWEWQVQGDEASILFRAENNLCTFSVFAGNPPLRILVAVWAVRPLARPQRWEWLRTFEEEGFTEV